MKMLLLRHSTVVITFGGKNIMVDPVLTGKGSRAPFPTFKKGRRKANPLVSLPVDKEELRKIIESLDAVLVTHMHSDHFDCSGEIPSNMPVICQKSDIKSLAGFGYKNLHHADGSFEWEGIGIERVRCRHGGFIVGELMGRGSGYILRASGETPLYIAGDTVWCHDIAKALKKHKPGFIILNCGGAQLPLGRSITMNERDVEKVCIHAPQSGIAAVHMEAFNHCLVTRKDLKEYLERKGLSSRVIIPEDGEYYEE